MKRGRPGILSCVCLAPLSYLCFPTCPELYQCWEIGDSARVDPFPEDTCQVVG